MTVLVELFNHLQHLILWARELSSPGKHLNLHRNSEQVCMQIQCPQCGTKMLLYVGLVPAKTDDSLECINCQNKMTPNLPGNVVRGPFAADEE